MASTRRYYSGPYIIDHAVLRSRLVSEIAKYINFCIDISTGTSRVYRRLFPNAGRIPRVIALAGHSLVVKSKRWPPVSAKSAVSASSLAEPLPTRDNKPRVTPDSTGSAALPDVCHAIFTSDPTGYTPEIFSRSSGDIWLGGLNSSTLPLPALANDAVPDSEAIDTLLHTGKALCGHDVEVLRSSLSFRPDAPTGRPIIARIHEADLGDGAKVPGGVFVATGHGSWGVSLSLGTGYVVSEMVLGREPSVDVKALGTWEE